MSEQNNPNRFNPRTSNTTNRRRKANRDGIITMCFIALIAIIIIVLVILLVKAVSKKAPVVVPTSSSEVTVATDATTSTESTKGSESTTATAATTEPASTTDSPVIVIPGYAAIEIPSYKCNQGSLVVVNSDHPYVANTNSQLVSLYNQEGFATIYRLRNSHVSLQSSIVQNFVDMITALRKSTYCSLTSGDIYLVKYAAAPTDPWRVTDPDNEDITGWALDLRIRLASGLEAPLTDDEAYWIKSYAAEYGFVLRYQEGKEKVTGEDYDSSHLRYVGVVHAKYMNARNFSLEEYVAYLKSNTSYDKPMTYEFSGSQYSIYYVSASSSDTTTFYIPDGYTLDSYSGDNEGGFIVVALKNK